MKEKRIFITGGAGFIGANLVRYLLDKGGSAVTVFDNLSAVSRENLDQAVRNSRQISSIDFVEGDVLDYEALESSMRGSEAVIHLAAHPGVVESIENPSKCFTVNSVGTFNVLEAARINGIGTFIFASSNASVGEQTPPIHEEMVPLPISPYGASKLHGEALCSAYFHSYGIKAMALRFANVYGPFSSHKDSVIARFIGRAKVGEPLEVYGDGTQTRDFVYVLDICQAIELALNFELRDPNLNLVFQIGSGIETRVIDVADMVNQCFDNEHKEGVRVAFIDPRKGETHRSISDTTKSRTLLGFSPRTNLQEDIKALCRMLLV
jgi:UDP-glucose 4-epimerase